jgi:hypothetical protein
MKAADAEEGVKPGTTAAENAERTYHRRRRQDAFGRLTPIEYETIRRTAALQAA